MSYDKFHASPGVLTRRPQGPVPFSILGARPAKHRNLTYLPGYDEVSPACRGLRGKRQEALDDECHRGIKPLRIKLEVEVAKKATKKKVIRKDYTTSDVKLLKMHSKARTPVSKLAKLMKRSEGSLRQKALKLGIGLGHQR